MLTLRPAARRELSRWAPGLAVECLQGSQEERRRQRKRLAKLDSLEWPDVLLCSYRTADGKDERQLLQRTKFECVLVCLRRALRAPQRS